MHTPTRIRLSDQFKCLSVLLHFPDAELIERLPGARQQVAALFDGIGPPIDGFLAYVIRTPLIDLQEAYSETFDLNPSHSLNLTYHLWGDRKERGAAMARFARTYVDAGFAPATGELPDFVPLVLEFLSVAEDGADEWILAEYAETLRTLENRLHTAESPYANVFAILNNVLLEG